MSTKSHRLADQQEALDAFFESLLHDVEAYAEQEEDDRSHSGNRLESVISIPGEPAPEPVIMLEPAVLAKPVAMVEETPSLFETLPPLAPPVQEVEIPDNADSLAGELDEGQPEPVEEVAQKPESADPPWLGQELQAMLFKVAGLTLAVPLVDLNGVVEWDEEKVTSMPGHADFYLGLMSHLNHQIPVVDTARMVLPDSKRRQLAGEDPRQRVTRVVLINDSQYGLACDEVNEVVTLKADAVRWRSERTQRRWLAGTVIEHMCALVDATAFAELLANRTPVDAFRT